MKVAYRGVRGSVPVAERSALGYGGNTACVSVELEGGQHLVLDAGTGIRALGATIDPTAGRSTSCSPTCTSTTSPGCCSSRRCSTRAPR